MRFLFILILILSIRAHGITVEYYKDGVPETVLVDTATPANTLSLPVGYFNAAGVQTDLATEATAQLILADTTAMIAELQTMVAELQTLGAVDFATEATLSALNTKVTTSVNGILVDGSGVTQPISAVSLPLPTGAATEAKQDAGIGELQTLNAKDFATETTLDAGFTATNTNLGTINATLGTLATEATVSALSNKLPASLGAKTGAESLSVVMASDQTLSVNVGQLAPVDHLDTSPVYDAGSIQIDGSGTALGSITPVVAALAGDASAIRVADTTGEFIGVYANDTLVTVINPGADGVIQAPFSAGAEIKLRSMGADAITTGNLFIEFLN